MRITAVCLGFSVSEEIKPTLTVALKYFDGKPVIEEISRTSKPSLRVYMGSNDLPKVRSGLGIAIISTSQGVMTDRAARTAGIGGEVLCTVF
jgi:small subunit ribosomal protein S8